MSVTGPLGFVAAGVACGIKAAGQLDLALVATDDGTAVPAAGVFTANRAAAPSVQLSRRHLVATGGRAAAVVLSSGNANAATGARGMHDVEAMCAATAAGLGAMTEEVLVAQTGLIGIPLPVGPLGSGIPVLLDARSGSRQAAADAATAIMTTDTVRKEVLVEGEGFRVGAMAKGAAMLEPSMATMLAVLTTDAQVGDAQVGDTLLGDLLRHSVEGSFNRMTVDGCMSTNDTVLVLASGRSGVAPGAGALAEALGEACQQLAASMAADAEGATKVAHVVVEGAVSDDEAHRAARKVAGSLLVKCSLNGEDPYWGRVVSELGSAGVGFELDRVQVSYGGVAVCRAGVSVEHDAAAVRRHMAGRSITITCGLGIGAGRAAVLTTDLGHGYIDENRGTS